VDGDPVVADDVLLTADEPRLAREATRAARRLMERGGRG
jgi:hypothetical protein